MRSSTLVMIGFAVLFGVLAVFLAQAWLNTQAEMRAKRLETQQTPLATRTIVVAAKPLRFGGELGATSLRELPWPQEALPAGAFATIAELTSSRRVVLTAIETNEPILASKITGNGQRATLSAMLEEGMKAVTIRVNDVEGVAGFVLPGERVDVVLTRQQEKTAAADVVLQNVRVLAVDQLADERSERPSVAKAVTLEVDQTSAQKVALAATVGTLSLVLRKAGDTSAASARPITLNDLPKVNNSDDRISTISVVRAGQKVEYSVPTEADGHALASAGAR